MITKLLFKKNYLAMIENAAKSENWLFRNFYIEQGGKTRDILENGGLSCAVFGSSILYLFNSVLEFMGKDHWIGFTHANCTSTEKDMIQYGWKEISNLETGAVIFWEVLDGNSHMGFYVGNDEAISNDSRGNGFPHKHHYTYNGTRKIVKIYWHPVLDEE